MTDKPTPAVEIVETGGHSPPVVVFDDLPWAFGEDAEGLPPLRKGDVRIRLSAVSFNPVDYQIRKGQSEARNVTSPILGRDLSGVVDAVHAGVSGFSPGDEV